MKVTIVLHCRLSVVIFVLYLTGISTVLYEVRLGGLSDQRDPELQSFIDAVTAMFKSSETLVNLPVSLAKYLARADCKKHNQAWATIFKISETYIITTSDTTP